MSWSRRQDTSAHQQQQQQQQQRQPQKQKQIWINNWKLDMQLNDWAFHVLLDWRLDRFNSQLRVAPLRRVLGKSLRELRPSLLAIKTYGEGGGEIKRIGIGTIGVVIVASSEIISGNLRHSSKGPAIRALAHLLLVKLAQLGFRISCSNPSCLLLLLLL